MEVKTNAQIGGLGLFATESYIKGEIIFVLKGEETNFPTRESIYVGNNTHVLDQMGQFINAQPDTVKATAMAACLPMSQLLNISAII